MTKRRGEIVAIKDLFAKYRQTLQAPQKNVEMEALKVIGEILQITLKENQIEYTPSTRTLYLKISSLIKQEVKIKQKDILQALKQNLGPKSCPKSII